MSFPSEHSIEVRVRYAECDPMGYAHHSAYPVWFEMARTELLRAAGLAYADLERSGMLIVVARLRISHHRPARYDDVLSVTATLRRAAGARIEHDYAVERDGLRLASASITLACIDRTGRPRPVPEALRYEPAADQPPRRQGRQG